MLDQVYSLIEIANSSSITSIKSLFLTEKMLEIAYRNFRMSLRTSISPFDTMRVNLCHFCCHKVSCLGGRVVSSGNKSP